MYTVAPLDFSLSTFKVECSVSSCFDKIIDFFHGGSNVFGQTSLFYYYHIIIQFLTVTFKAKM